MVHDSISHPTPWLLLVGMMLLISAVTYSTAATTPSILSNNNKHIHHIPLKKESKQPGWTDQRNFLRSFYFSTGGPYWRNNTGWNTLDTKDETNYCSWRGVRCVKDESVLSIALVNNNLTGLLPSGVSVLKDLMILDLGFNNLYGQIPKEYSELEYLNGFAVGSNHFEGMLPERFCGILSCDAYNNPKLKCPSNNCRNNHCNMSQCNCGGMQMCNDDNDCAGKLCGKCKQQGSNPWYKICQ
ncbi:hypothetical protein C9374_012879 [Naegleria lovaniensis]|uniref:Leucine-rich repeat-containing N-terminal plant-type domain-containing protein n=1 Tax=Naegleria lovaniensis TaxID=51637 RepID=A0AA88GDW8_NAELO|nr:uncharacterized protein C9374_012879 [Naegleria lovaniensis]KAG2373033.1 hypothetical protein C9374_012879 [Naegleria lovaniensis]